MSKRKGNRDPAPSVKKIHGHWLKKVKHEGVVELIGECAYDNITMSKEVCYACGKEASLQRCHITPHSCGGSDTDVDNYFLMCIDCHQNNPDTVYPKLFWHFVRGRPQHLNVFFDEAWKVFSSLWKDSSEEDIKALHEFAKLPSSEQLSHHLSIPVDKLAVSLNNQMSIYTGVGAMFMNILDYKPKHPPSSVL